MGACLGSPKGEDLSLEEVLRACDLSDSSGALETLKILSPCRQTRPFHIATLSSTIMRQRQASSDDRKTIIVHSNSVAPLDTTDFFRQSLLVLKDLVALIEAEMRKAESSVAVVVERLADAVRFRAGGSEMIEPCFWGIPSPKALRHVSAASSMDSQKNKILIADERRSVVEDVCAMARRVGLEPLRAFDGEQVIDVFDKNKDDVRCILMGLGLPSVDNFVATSSILDRGENCPIVALTDDEDHHRRQCLDAGFTDVARLPSNYEDLADIIGIQSISPKEE